MNESFFFSLSLRLHLPCEKERRKTRDENEKKSCVFDLIHYPLCFLSFICFEKIYKHRKQSLKNKEASAQ